MTPELYVLLAYVLSGLTYIGCVVLLERPLIVGDVALSLLPVLNTMHAVAFIYVITCESSFANKTIWRKK